MIELNKDLKKIISVLVNKYNHEIDYKKNKMFLSNGLNEIEIWKSSKHGINISYNVLDNSVELMEDLEENIYNYLLPLFTRKTKELIDFNKGILISLEEWIKEEGEFVREQLKALKIDISNKKVYHRDLGGNRYLAEYYNGIIILRDDLAWAKSNVISLDDYM